MAYRVILTNSALVDALSAADYIAEQGSLETSKRWFDELNAKLRSLSKHPHRCGFARENDQHEAELRQLLFKSHRVIYKVEGDAVVILHVLHQRQDEAENLQ